MVFLSTLSLRRATRDVYAVCLTRLDFYPRSPCGERRRAAYSQWTPPIYFYPRSPCGERLSCIVCPSPWLLFLSTLSLRRATLSIFLMVSVSLYFYPRSPCGERPSRFVRIGCILLFLSTLSLRRATVYLASQTFDIDISIHALLAESDQQQLR